MYFFAYHEYVLYFVYTMQDYKNNIIGTVLNFMELDESIWKKYFLDFITYKLHVTIIDSESDLKLRSDIPIKILQSFFAQLNTSGHIMANRLVELHCHAAVHHINLAQLAILLRPLCEVHKVNLCIFS